MNFNVDLKKMVRDAGTVVSRVVQLTEEKLGTSEKTELDSHFENLAERADTTKQWTEKLLKDTESVLTPNPGNRVEDFLYEKIEKKRPNRLSNLEYLGQDMIEAGNEFGPGTPYGTSLIKIGQCEQRLGQIEREFIASAHQCFLVPLRKYLDGEMKTITTERGVLESKRLDLDACKNRVRKARSMIGQPTKEGPSPEYLLEMAERDLRVAQSEFDRQVEITRLLLESVGNSLATHQRYLHDLFEAQLTYYHDCQQAMQDLKHQLTSISPSCTVRSGSGGNIAGGATSEPAGGTTKSGAVSMRPNRARVLCDYSAWDSSELSLSKDEVILVQKISETEKEYVMAERGNQRGKVPLAYLEILNN